MVNQQRELMQPSEEPAPVTESQEIVPVNLRDPVPPRDISVHETEELRRRAAELTRQLEEATGGRELEAIDSLSSLGIQAQRSAGSDLELLRGRVGDMISQGGPGAQISNDLLELRLVLNQMDPHGLTRGGVIKQIVTAIPFFGPSNPVVRKLEKLAIRYESLSKQVGAIETRLRDGRTMLTRDNIELRKLYEQVESQQTPVQKNAYFGELIMGRLEELVRRTDDPARKERFRDVLHDVSLRVQDLRTMEEVYIQFFVSIEMTRRNNNRLGQSTERTLALATNVVMVGLAIQAALVRQKRVQEAIQHTREFLGNLILANAASIKQHTAEIGDIYNSPVVAIEKITQAHNDLLEAITTVDRLKLEGIESARENITRLKELSEDLQQKAYWLGERPDRVAPSVEA